MKRVRIDIRRKEGLSDPEGVATLRALRDLGYAEVGEVHFGRMISLDLPDGDDEETEARVEEMCRRLLANPVIEDWTVETIE
jgi:phosphoribosylformylglycinamidine synthase subunit PurS